MKVKDLIKSLSTFDGEKEIAVQNDNYHSMQIEVSNLAGSPALIVFSEGEDNE